MNVLDAACAVLRDAGTPLHCTVLTQRMIDRKLWHTEGKTPVNTVGAALAVDVKRQGAASRFVRTSKGVFGLRHWHYAGLPLLQDRAADAPPPQGTALDRPADATGASPAVSTEAADSLALGGGLAAAPTDRDPGSRVSAVATGAGGGTRADAGGAGATVRAAAAAPSPVAQANDQVRLALLRQLINGGPADFQDRLERLLPALGLREYQVTPRWGEAGFDVRGTVLVAGALHVRVLLQARRWRHTVQAADIVQLRGSLGAHEQGLLITTGDVGGSARDEAARTDTAPVGLIDGRLLSDLLAEHGIGVRRTPQVLLELGEAEA